MRCIASRFRAHCHHLDLKSRFSCIAHLRQSYSCGPLISAQADETRVSVKVGLKSFVPLTLVLQGPRIECR